MILYRYYECVYKLFKKLAMGIALIKKVIYSPTPETVTAEFCIIFQSIGPTCNTYIYEKTVFVDCILLGRRNITWERAELNYPKTRDHKLSI